MPFMSQPVHISREISLTSIYKPFPNFCASASTQLVIFHSFYFPIPSLWGSGSQPVAAQWRCIHYISFLQLDTSVICSTLFLMPYYCWSPHIQKMMLISIFDPFIFVDNAYFNFTFLVQIVILFAIFHFTLVSQNRYHSGLRTSKRASARRWVFMGAKRRSGQGEGGSMFQEGGKPEDWGGTSSPLSGE